jgi:hypothetical protein
MNKEQFKKNLYHAFRVQPAMQLYERNGILRGSVDDAWIVTEIADDSFKLRNRASDHTIQLGFDSLVNFVEDPAGKVQHQTQGILVLKAQLYMHEGLLKFAPTIAPGKELRDFTPPITRKDLFDAVRSRLDDDRLQRLREDFANRSFPEAKRAFDDLGSEMHALIAELRERGLDAKIDLYPYSGGYLVFTAGWWVTIALKGGGLPRDVHLSLIKWRGRPNVPGLLAFSFDHAAPVSEQKYHYRLARIDEAGWIAPGEPDLALSTREVLERLLIDLFDKPNTELAPIWDDLSKK